jgi:predicted Ser/Thr protein kinase
MSQNFVFFRVTVLFDSVLSLYPPRTVSQWGNWEATGMTENLRDDLAETAGVPTENAPGESQALRVVEILDQYLAGLRAGEKPDRAALLKEHPELAAQLEACLAGLEFIHHSSDTGSTPKRLGDFEIVREVGRGGMGAVYEARQVSLARPVALKILRFGGVCDSDAVGRFQREAETVASLHHTNIVPIFAVGHHEGVNYYAMQFIEGRSLDQVLAQHADQSQRIAAETVAQWGLQAAEALAHAHARGVIHRDVKPSNLILDDEGRIWLTDFGLAKRIDDVTLSMTGALLGTPRYMSPEQASAAHHKLDHRTDIYSLGATLYELVTGKPVFSGTSPHDLITQIITREPASARSVCPTLPRDFDTILMKCLSKNSSQRYSSAQELVDDLRAFEQGRPIAARRVGSIEKLGRWVKSQRKSVALTGIAVTATLALVFVIGVGTYAWHRSQLATIMLRTKNPPLVAELLRNGHRVLPPVTVPTQQRQEVLAGDYQMRVSGAGRLSQTIDLTLTPGAALEQSFNLDNGLLWKDVKVEGGYRLVERQGAPVTHAPVTHAPVTHAPATDAPVTQRADAAVGMDIIELNAQGLRCLTGMSGQTRWELNLVQPTQPLLADGMTVHWPWNKILGANYSNGLGIFDCRPWVVSSEDVDFNGDGQRDMVLAARHQAWLIAIDGRDGALIWIAARGETALSNPLHTGGLQSTVLDSPILVADQDDDDVADMLVSFVFKDRETIHRWVELVSGGTGKPIWHHDLSAEMFSLDADETIPEAMQWYYSGGGGHSGGSVLLRDYYRIRDSSNPSRQTSDIYRQGPLQLHPAGDRAAEVMTLCGKQLVRLHLSTGQPVASGYGQATLPVRPALNPGFGDFDGDGQTDLLLTQSIGTAQQRLIAWSPEKNVQLWHIDISAELPRQTEVRFAPPDWPQVVDLDNDGAPEVIVPGESTNEKQWRPPWGLLQVIDGSSGKLSWTSRIFNADHQLEHFLAGPDIDGDGVRELFVASQWGQDLDLYVDCLSGKDGSSLWKLEQPLAWADYEDGWFRIGQLQWIDSGADGWPQLVIAAHNSNSGGMNADATDRVAFVSAGTGNLSTIALDVSRIDIGDLNADGLSDFVIVQEANPYDMHDGATLHAIRGGFRQSWHRRMSPHVNVGDLNGDGIGDLVPASVDATVAFAARSGASGEIIWQSTAMRRSTRHFADPAIARDPQHEILVPRRDFNGDGVPDILLSRDPSSYGRDLQPVVTAISGVNGRLIWETEFAVSHLDAICMLEVQDLSADGELDILLVASCDYGQPTHLAEATSPITGTWRNDPQLWIATISAADGRVQWAKPLCEVQRDDNTKQFEFRRSWLEAAYSDLNADGVLDLVLPGQRAPGSIQLDMCAISGSDGEFLWRSALLDSGFRRDAFTNAIPATCGDLNGDGVTEVIVASFGSDPAGNIGTFRMSALTGESGHRLWDWDQTIPHRDNVVDGRKERLQDRLRPQLVQFADGNGAIAILFRNREYELVIVDNAGKTFSEKKYERYFSAERDRIWTIDADNDGQHELLLVDQAKISLLPIEKLDQPIWQCDKMSSNLETIVGLIPDANALGRLVVAGGIGDNSLRGLDPLTGETRWTCIGPGASNKSVEASLLNAPSAELPPLGLFDFDSTMLVRQATTPALGFSAWQSWGRVQAITTPATDDSRLRRPLPWVPAAHSLDDLEQVIGWTLFYAITLAVIPFLFLYWTISHRQWGLKTLLVLPVVVSNMMLAALISPTSRELMQWEAKLAVVLFTIPVLVTTLLFINWYRSGKRGRLVAFLLATTLVTLVLGFMAIQLDASRRGTMQIGEHYDWSGWYFGLFPVLYWMLYIPFLWIVAAWLGRHWWMLLGRILPRRPKHHLG